MKSAGRVGLRALEWGIILVTCHSHAYIMDLRLFCPSRASGEPSCITLPVADWAAQTEALEAACPVGAAHQLVQANRCPATICGELVASNVRASTKPARAQTASQQMPGHALPCHKAHVEAASGTDKHISKLAWHKTRRRRVSHCKHQAAGRVVYLHVIPQASACNPLGWHKQLSSHPHTRQTYLHSLPHCLPAEKAGQQTGHAQATTRSTSCRS